MNAPAHISTISPVYATIREDGYQARRDGQSAASVSYRAGSRSLDSWLLGWSEADAHIYDEAEAARNWLRRRAI